MSSYYFSPSVNEVGNLASGIYKYDFDEDPSLVNPSFLSGWLENNVGELNVLIHSSFSGENPGMSDQEQSIYRQVFLKDFYKKLGRKMLLGIGSGGGTTTPGQVVTSDWTELRDGDSVIRRRALLASPGEKVGASRQYSAYAQDADIALRELVYKYNITKGGPRQIAGKDAPL